MSRRLLLAALLCAAALTGCHTCNKVNYVAGRPRCCTACADAPVTTARLVPVPVPAPAGVVPAAPPPMVSPPVAPPPAAIGRPVPVPAPAAEAAPLPAGPVAPAPPANVPPPAAPPPAGTEPLPASPPPPSDPPVTAEKPADVQLGPPAPARRDSYSIAPPSERREPPLAAVPEKPAPEAVDNREPPTRPAPDTRESREPAKPAPENGDNPQPIDLPGYALARPGVASGLRPFPDGITWLKDRGYVTVLHLKAPGEDNSAARKLFEKKGLNYLSLETSPARLTKETYEQFNRLVTDTRLQPLFVYDKDGSVAGGLWYLHFRVNGMLTAEKARAEAQRLGLRFDDDTEHQAMWLAVQSLQKSLLP